MFRKCSNLARPITPGGPPMSEPSSYDYENRALALSAFNLVKALIDGLERKGVLEAGDVQAVFDQTLIALEHRAQDQATDLARRIMEATVMAHVEKSKGSE